MGNYELGFGNWELGDLTQNLCGFASIFFTLGKGAIKPIFEFETVRPPLFYSIITTYQMNPKSNAFLKSQFIYAIDGNFFRYLLYPTFNNEIEFVK